MFFGTLFVVQYRYLILIIVDLAARDYLAVRFDFCFEEYLRHIFKKEATSFGTLCVLY